VVHIVEWRGACKVLVGKRERNKQLLISRLGDNIKWIFRRRVGMVEHGLNLSG
jgi:hypothetical protein